RRQRETRSSAAHDDRRDQDMQAVETTGGEEPRNRIGPALDQDAAEAARGERGNDGAGGELAVVRGNRHDFDAGGEVSRPARARRGQTRARAPPPPPSPRGGEAAPHFGPRPPRPGLGPPTRRTVICEPSVRAVPTPITPASTSARSRCGWGRPASLLM